MLICDSCCPGVDDGEEAEVLRTSFSFLFTAMTGAFSKLAFVGTLVGFGTGVFIGTEVFVGARALVGIRVDFAGVFVGDFVGVFDGLFVGTFKARAWFRSSCKARLPDSFSFSISISISLFDGSFAELSIDGAAVYSARESSCAVRKRAEVEVLKVLRTSSFVPFQAIICAFCCVVFKVLNVLNELEASVGESYTGTLSEF